MCLIEALNQALTLEYAAAKRAENDTVLPVAAPPALVDSEVGESGETFSYAIEVARDIPRHVQPDAMLRIRDGADEFPAKVVKIISEDRLILSTQHSLPLDEDLELRLSAAELVEALRNAVLDRRAMIDFVAYRIQNGFQGSGGGTHARPPVLALAEDEVARMNEEQVEAVSRTLQDDLLFVWGPPGTGKTWTLGRMAAILARRFDRVLVVAPTHTAVDGCTRAIWRSLTRRERDDHWLLRLGPFIENEDVPREAVSVASHIRLLGPSAEFEELQVIQALLEKVSALREQHDALRKELAGKTAQSRKIKAIREERLTELAEARAALAAHRHLSWIRRAWAGRQVDAVLEERVSIHTEREREAMADWDAVNDQCRELSDRIKRIDDQIEAEAGRPFDVLLEEKRRLREALRNVTEEDRNARLAEALRRAKIVCSTVASTYMNPVLSSLHFDAVLMDEASMIVLPAALYAATFAEKRIILGDFRQLPPIALAEKKQLEDGTTVQEILGKDLFEFAGVDKSVDRDEGHGDMVALRDQYRAPAALVSIYNEPYYLGRLRTPGPPPIRNLAFGHPSVFINTASSNPACLKTNRSWENAVHVDVVMHAIKEAVAAGITEIAVIAPFRSQSARIRHRLRAEKLHCDGIRVATIHRFQGQESELVIFDTVWSPGDGHTGPNWPEYYALLPQKGRLLNVAFSRAKHQLVVIGNLPHLRRRVNARALFWMMLENIKGSLQWDGTELCRPKG
jgi:hypothetical protein